MCCDSFGGFGVTDRERGKPDVLETVDPVDDDESFLLRYCLPLVGGVDGDFKLWREPGLTSPSVGVGLVLDGVVCPLGAVLRVDDTVDGVLCLSWEAVTPIYFEAREPAVIRPAAIAALWACFDKFGVAKDDGIPDDVFSLELLEVEGGRGMVLEDLLIEGICGKFGIFSSSLDLVSFDARVNIPEFGGQVK